MDHPFSVLGPEYLDLLGRCTITRATEAMAEAKRILPFMPRYKAVSAKTGVPAVWLAAVNERESDSSFLAFFGNGDRLDRVTVHVPAHRGPFTGPDAWECGCEDALALDKVSSVTDWSWARACYEGELWNGFGPRAHGRHTGYLWAGTNIYDGGKYVSDNCWDPNASDKQLGIVPLVLALIELDASLALPGWPANKPWPAIPAPAPVPAGHDGGEHGTEWLQESLNKLLNAGLDVDGSFGRRTAAAVRQFQAAHALAADGLAGSATIAAIEEALKVLPPPATSAPVPAAAPQAEPAPEAPKLPDMDTIRTAARLQRAIYAYEGEPVETWDHLFTKPDGIYVGMRKVGTRWFAVFRGSVTLDDWLNNIKAWTIFVKNAAHMHAGFYEDVPWVLPQIMAVAGADDVTFIGHSRGAGEATEAAVCVLANTGRAIPLITWGKPRVGYGDLATIIAPLPRIAFRARSGAKIDPITEVPFEIPGIEPYIDDTPFTDLDIAPAANDPWPGSLALHHMQGYQEATERFLSPLPLAQAA